MRISAVELLKRIRHKIDGEMAGMTPEEQEARIRTGAERYDARAKQRRAERAAETAGMTAKEADDYIMTQSRVGWEALVKATESMTKDEAYDYLIAKTEAENAEWDRQQAERAAGGQARPRRRPPSAG